MNDKVYKFLMVVLAGAVIAGFFLPWITVESKPVGSLMKILTGQHQETVQGISGFRIPIFANREESHIIITIATLFKPGIENVDKKSYLVWAVPVLAFIILVLALHNDRSELLNFLFAVIGLVIFAYSFYKLQTTNLDKLLFEVKPGLGGWLTLGGYLSIGVLGFLQFVILAAGKSKR